MSFLETLTVDEATTTRDLTPYNEVLDNIRVGHKGTLVVPTGTTYTEGPHKGKGKTAMEHERGFREAASARKIGLTVRHNVLGEQTRLILIPKAEMRTFSPEQIKKRTEALAKARMRKAVDKYMLENPEATREVAVKEVQKIQAARKAEAAAKK
jgi:hypothetical protein